jgi:hypothetical protein
MSERMREEFEAAYVAWLVERCGEGFRSTAIHSLRRRDDGGYQHYPEQVAWWAWGASRAALVVELPAKKNSTSYHDGGDQHDALVDKFAAALDAAGVRSK